MLDSIGKRMDFEYLYNVEITTHNPLSDQQPLLQEAYDTLVKEHQKL